MWPLQRAPWPVQRQHLLPAWRAQRKQRALQAIQRRRLALREERDLALQAIKELEVDRATNHIGDEDYAALVAEYRAQAAEAIAALDDDDANSAT